MWDTDRYPLFFSTYSNMISKSIRYRAVVHYERFLRSIRKVAQIYSVSKSSLQRWINEEPRIRKRTSSKIVHKTVKDCIEETLRATPMTSLQQLCSIISHKCGLKRCSNSTASRWLRQLDFSRKKVYNTVANPPACDTLAKAFCSQYAPLDNSEIICIDEAGFYIGDHSRRGYSKRGQRIHIPSSRTLRKSRLSLVMAIGIHGIVHYKILEGNCNKDAFVSFINELPRCVNGKTLIMDNVSFHHSLETKKAIFNAGCKVLYIPPYSPRFNAIEYAFSTLKHTYRSICDLSHVGSTKDDFTQALVISIELSGSFHSIFKRVKDTVMKYCSDGVLLRYD